MKPTVYHHKYIQQWMDEGKIKADRPILPSQVQPASLDLRIGGRAWKLRDAFAPDPSRNIQELIQIHATPYTGQDCEIFDSIRIMPGEVWIFELEETFVDIDAQIVTSPKSSTGRLDLLTRTLGHSEYDRVNQDDQRNYIQVVSNSFPIIISPGDAITQARFLSGESDEKGGALTAHIPRQGIISCRPKANASKSLGINLSSNSDFPAMLYWDFISMGNLDHLTARPGEFHIFRSKEILNVPIDECIDILPYATDLGEARVHYAGFVDPGFQGSIVLEYRAHNFPQSIRDGQPVARYIRRKLFPGNERSYGGEGSSYQNQRLRLGKQFSM